METELFEKLADLEHQQWIKWSRELAQKEKLSPERVERWATQCWIPYSELSEGMKEFDREWARKIVKLISEEILKHQNCKVMHDLGKHGKGEMTCLDKVLESLGYKSEEIKNGK